MQPKPRDLTPWFIGTPFAVIGLVLVSIAIYLFARDGAMSNWPRADGVVISSTIQTSMTQYKDKQGYWHPYESCVPKVRYSYTVDASTINGKVLEGSSLTREPFAASRAEAQRWIDRYPVGKAVKVYYDPKDPATSMLELKTSVAAVILGALGSFFLLFGIAFLVALRLLATGRIR